MILPYLFIPFPHIYFIIMQNTYQHQQRLNSSKKMQYQNDSSDSESDSDENQVQKEELELREMAKVFFVI